MTSSVSQNLGVEDRDLGVPGPACRVSNVSVGNDNDGNERPDMHV